jgi:hypothetical protein
MFLVFASHISVPVERNRSQRQPLDLRSLREIAFRARQEARNLSLWASPPRTDFVNGFRPWVPPADPAGREDVVEKARAIQQHRFQIFGQLLETGPAIRWRRDYARDIETPLVYFRRLPYLDAERAGDHKWIWELSRHQHLVTLAQAFRLTNEAGFLQEAVSQLESWLVQNPFLRGINWASALEAAFRALSWIWTWGLIAESVSHEFRDRWLRGLYLHGCFIENNLSVYFSPNTHLLGEALALQVLGLFFSSRPRARRWQTLGAALMRAQMDAQVRADGSHVEQSSYYHCYALDMFRFHAALAPCGEGYIRKLRRMKEYRSALCGPSGRLPLIGDDDGGMLLTPEFHDPALEPVSRLFPDAGVAVMVAGGNHVVIDAGPFGPWRAGHSHADTLSLIVRRGGEDILVDPGTFTYTGDLGWRDWFRSTQAHNTISINGLSQATPEGPFAWAGRPRVQVHEWRTGAERDVLDAECSYSGFVHRRRVEFEKPHSVSVCDLVTGPPGEHRVEQWWHLGSDAACSRLELPPGAERTESPRSDVFGSMRKSTALCVRQTGTLPMRLTARIDL